MKIVKAEVLVPTVEYGNIKFQLEGTAEDMMDEARRLIKGWTGGFGLPPKEYNAFLDQYINDGTGNLETYNLMSKDQQAVIQELKKAFKRIKSRNGHNEEE